MPMRWSTSSSSLLPCLTAFLLLPEPVSHVLWLPLFLDGCSGSSLQRRLGRPEGRQRGSQSKVARGSLVEGALIWNMQEAGTSFPLGLAPTTPSARDQAGVTVPLQSHSHCLPALRCAARYRRLRAPGPTTLSPQPHAVSFAPPPLSTLGGLFFSPLLTLSPLNPFQPGLPTAQSSSLLQPPPRPCRATKGPWLRYADPIPLYKPLLFPVLHSDMLHSQTHASRLS